MAPKPTPSDPRAEALALIARHSKTQGIKCTLGKLAATTTDPVVMALLDLAGQVPHSTLARALTESTGDKVSEHTVSRHAARGCACRR